MSQQRYYSLDVFRGATVALMILVNNPGSWAHIYSPLEHANWHGCTPTDLVFPFFLFAVGNAMTFVMPKLQQSGNAIFYKKVIKRTLLIFIIGLLLNWCPFFIWQNDQLVFKQWAFMNKDAAGVAFEDGVRILGVLQRIAICYFFASLIAYYFKPKTALFISIGILLFYWVVCFTLGEGNNPYTLETFFGAKIDAAIVGKHHLLHADKIAGKVYHFDYEGLVSSTAAIVQVLFGYFVGYYIQKKGKTYEMLSNLLIAGIVLCVAGYAWNMVFPINKKIWTSSYVLYTSGLGILTLSVLIYLIEFKSVTGVWSKFFDVFGKNPLFIFVLSGVIPRLLNLIQIPLKQDGNGKQIILNPLSWFYEQICKPLFPSEPNLGSFIYSLCFITMMWFFAWLLDKKKIYKRINVILLNNKFLEVTNIKSLINKLI
jgi:predicted acyltransferase